LNNPNSASENLTINQQIESTEKQAIEAQKEIEKIVEKRDKLNQQCKQLRQEIHALKTERDAINEKVHTLKTQRDETRTTVRPVIEEIKVAREKIAELRKKTPKRRQSDLQKELNDIEWKIQTTSLDLKEEKRLIEDVKQLEIQLSAYKKIDAQYKRIAELQHGLKAVDSTGGKLHSELSELAQKSQELHQKMIEKIAEAKKTKEEADNLHNTFLLEREKARQLDEQKRRLAYEERNLQRLERQQRASERQERQAQRLQERQMWESQRKIEEEQRQQETETRKVAEKELKEKLGCEAREKLEKGKKLSWQEFQLLAGENEEEDEKET
jgi:uncharacterized coiled-coil DUF342 family protein